MNFRNMLFFFLSLNLVAVPVCARDLKIVEAQEALMKQDFDGFFKKIDELEKNEDNAKEVARILDEAIRDCEHAKSWKNIQRAVCASFAVLGASHFIAPFHKAALLIRGNFVLNKTLSWYSWLLSEIYGNPARLILATSYLAAGLAGWQKAGKDKKLIDLFKQKLASVKENVVGRQKKISESK